MIVEMLHIPLLRAFCDFEVRLRGKVIAMVLHSKCTSGIGTAKEEGS